MIAFSNCKVNIGLNILKKRKDGFHDIETLFYPINFVEDIIEIVENSSDKDTYHFSGKKIDSDLEKNLCFLTVQKMREKHSFPNIDLYLHKNVPMGAGLGGGSANVGTIIKLIDKNFDLNIPQKEQIEIASKLGSDTAFFIINKAALGEGRGDVLSTIDFSLSSYEMLIIHPEVHVSTAQAYANVKPKPANFSLKNIKELDIKEWKNHLKNDFEESIFKIHPQLGEIKSYLYDEGAIYAQMSGSGSAVYGIFEKLPQNISNDFGKVYFGKLG